MKKRRSPYARIVRAAEAGHGVRLTAAECYDMAHDAAIEARGRMDLDDWADEDEEAAPAGGAQEER